jgi:putative FmdB family regulatory protein
MPTYEYYCTECKFEFEEFQSIASEPIEHCPKCNGKVQRKISGGTGLIFKGSGFYITDYKNKKSSISKPTSKEKPKEKPKEEPKTKVS